MDAIAEHNNAAAQAAEEAGETIDIAGIMRAIPHRYPFLMIDRVIDLVRNKTCVGVKNVSVNEAFFQGHFPNHPVMPGELVYFMSIEGAKFRRPVVPGDRLLVQCDKERSRGNVWKFHAVARVDGVTCAEATFAAMIMDRAEPIP